MIRLIEGVVEDDAVGDKVSDRGRRVDVSDRMDFHKIHTIFLFG